ncbi:MAG: hypothetical protein AAF483_19050 [Planctomycetota bacterium]
MTPQSKSTTCAFAALCIGVVSAYPFLRDAKQDSTATGSAHDSQLNQKVHSSSAPVSSFSRDTQPNSSTVASNANPLPSALISISSGVSLNALPSTSVVAPAMPEWADSDTPLDDLVTTGAQSLSGKKEARELKKLPVWLNQQAKDANTFSKKTSQEVSDGWNSTTHASPFDAKSPSRSLQTATAAKLSWPDRTFDQWKQSFDLDKELKSANDFGSLVSSATAEGGDRRSSRGNQNGGQRNTKKRERKPRDRSYVYQPGHSPGESKGMP